METLKQQSRLRCYNKNHLFMIFRISIYLLSIGFFFLGCKEDPIIEKITKYDTIYVHNTDTIVVVDTVSATNTDTLYLTEPSGYKWGGGSYQSINGESNTTNIYYVIDQPDTSFVLITFHNKFPRVVIKFPKIGSSYMLDENDVPDIYIQDITDEGFIKHSQWYSETNPHPSDFEIQPDSDDTSKQAAEINGELLEINGSFYDFRITYRLFRHNF